MAACQSGFGMFWVQPDCFWLWGFGCSSARPGCASAASTRCRARGAYPCIRFDRICDEKPWRRYVFGLMVVVLRDLIFAFIAELDDTAK